MIQNGLVELSLEWYPDASNDIMSLGHIKVAPGTDRLAAAERIIRQFHPNIVLNVLMGNLPEQFICFLWTNSMRELNELKEALLKEEGIDSVKVNVLNIGYLFDTWRDRLLFAEH